MLKPLFPVFGVGETSLSSEECGSSLISWHAHGGWIGEIQVLISAGTTNPLLFISNIICIFCFLAGNSS
jgi:hypothetical protein